MAPLAKVAAHTKISVADLNNQVLAYFFSQYEFSLKFRMVHGQPDFFSQFSFDSFGAKFRSLYN